MRWERSVLALFEDLEQQAEGLHLVERDAEVGELSLVEYAQVELLSRLHASVDTELRVQLLGGRALAGRLSRVGAGWILLEDVRGHEWVVTTRAFASVGGLSSRSVSEDAWPLVARLTLRTMLRRIAAERSSCLLHLVDGAQLDGRLGRVGADFVEVHPTAEPPAASARGGSTALLVVPTRGLAAVQERP